MTLETVDRTIFEALRLALVAAGLLPDQTLYSTAAQYTAAKTALRATTASNQLIEIFGVGAPDPRDEKSVNKIVIDRVGYAKGGIGGFPAQFFEKVVTGPTTYTYDKYLMPSESKNLSYTIRCISNLVYYERIMLQIIDQVFGGRGYIKSVVDAGGGVITLTGDPIMVDLITMLDVTATSEKETLYTYTVPDVWITDPKKISTNVPPMSTVTAEYYYAWGTDDSLHIDQEIPQP